MAWRPHGRASVDRRSPRAWAVCDDCGFLYNRYSLEWQYQWFGARLQNTHFLKCQTCLDIPQEQLRVIVLPADPTPIYQPRPEQYAFLNNPISPLGIPIGTMTQAAGLAAAFDSNTNKPMFLSSVTYLSVAGANNSIGINFNNLAPNNQGVSVNQFQAWAPYDAKFFGGGPTAYAFQGSNTPVGFTTIVSGTTVGTVGETLNVTFPPSSLYLYYQLLLTGDGVNSVAVAQLQIASVSPP